MSSMERQEMNAHYDELVTDVTNLVDKYRSIFEWNVPEIDVAQSDKLIFEALRKALRGFEMKISS